MENKLLEIILEKQNSYRSYLRRAKQLYEVQGKHSEAECRLLQYAADVKAEIVRLTSNPTGSETEKKANYEELMELNAKIQQIRYELNPAKVKGRSSDQKTEENKPVQAEEVDEEISTNSWYHEAPKHSFDDVSGMEDVKNKLRDCMIDTDMERLAERLKMKQLHSFFFVGPPGCGKTYIIEAFIHELMEKEDYKYLSLNGAKIISKYVGDAEKIVEKLFQEAVENAPCVIFIDEIDGICKNRSIQALPEYAASITNSFLTGYNEINSADAKILFIGATNYPKKVDAAMLDRVEAVYVGLPDDEARRNAFAMHFDDLIQLEDGLTTSYMAKRTKGFNYRDIDKVVENIKKMIYREYRDALKAKQCEVTAEKFVDEAISALNSGSYCLTKKAFDRIIGAFVPSNKSEIIQDINEWLESREDYEPVEPEEDGILYELPEPVEDIIIPESAGTLPEEVAEEETEETLSEEVAKEETEETLPEEVVEEETEEILPEEVAEEETEEPLPEEVLEEEPMVTVCEECCTVNPMNGFVTIHFCIRNSSSENVMAAINGFNFFCEKRDDSYALSFQPAPGMEYCVVRVADETGYLGEFTVRIGSPIAENSNFDI